jgi:hypothetical protein
MKRIFISYSSKDKKFVERLAKDLKNCGIKPWIDLWEIKVGDSIIDKVEKGISESEFVVAVLSKHSVSSSWVQEELNSAKIREIEKGRKVILPIVIGNCKIPSLLAHKRYANFRYSYEDGLAELMAALGAEFDSHDDYLTGSADLKELVTNTISLLTSKYEVHSIHLLLNAETSHDVRLVMIGSALDEHSQRFRYATMKGIIGYSYRTGEQVSISDVSKDPRYVEADYRTLSELATPIVTERGRTIGVINIESNKTNRFSDNDLKFVSDISSAFGKWCSANGIAMIDADRPPYWEFAI